MFSRPRPARSPVTRGVAFVAACIGLAGLTSCASIHPVARATATPAPPPGFFQLTNLEWQGLKFARVQSADFPSVDLADGTIAAPDDTTTQVISPYTGRVTAVFVTVGDAVAPGTPLFAIDGSEFAQAQNDLATAIETLDSTRVQYHVTAANRAKLVALFETGGVDAKDVEQSRADTATALLAVRNAEIAAALARSHLRVLGFSPAAIERLTAARKPHGASATFGAAVVVRAPVGGVISQRAVGVGTNVQSAANGASNPLLTITGLGHVFLQAAVPESSIANVHLGDRLSVTMDAFPSRTFAGRVDYINPTVDPATHRIFVRSEVDNPDLALKPGMYGDMRITYGPPEQIVGVPEDAVIYEEDTARVWVAGPHETLAVRYIRAGKTVGGTVEALAGLRAGDTVVTSGSVFIDRALQGDE